MAVIRQGEDRRSRALISARAQSNPPSARARFAPVDALPIPPLNKCLAADCYMPGSLCFGC